MVHKRFQYINGLDIIAPLKHGTRWLDEETNPIKIIEDPLSYVNLKKYPITEKTYWIYRDTKEHLLSALMTEIRGAIEFENDNVDTIINNFIKGDTTHWSSSTFKIMYQYWNKYNFQPIHLSNISSLFDVKFKKEKYQMLQYTKTKYDVNEIIHLVGDDVISQLTNSAKEDEVYLNLILSNTHKLI